MLNNYRIYRRKQELGSRVTRLHNTEQLAIGILDTGNLEQLTNCLDWYTREMNYSLHVVTQEGRFDLGLMQEAYKDVTFLVFTSHTFTGEKVNAVANECRTNLFLIVRSDLLLVTFDGPTLLDAMTQSDHPAAFSAVVANAYREIIPCRRMPRMCGRHLDPDSGFPSLDRAVSLPSLYPFMCLGLYDRALFQRLRGFDEAIHSEYWQALDWGIRCHLLGYTVSINSALMVQFPDRESVIEDRSEAEGYLRCYTKALSVQKVNAKNVARKYKGFFDKEVYQTEVKKRMLWLQKLDFVELCARWPKEDA
ncbi:MULTISPECIES: hypothetical protein [unclassified Sphaerochaeta]|jgi:hypothetical protein|uniref:hypothetical protein n=1 Tax=unclassified Sphaerochaeta TaxID=2637943 RepID=UPI0025FF9FAE|nr:hypothetical protein [Sphaerochaeta sp. UBA5856]